MNGARWISIGLLAGAVIAATGLALQRQTNTVLREELDRAREEHRRLVKVRAEREQLMRERVPETELNRLRSDHAALVRLRAEVADLKARVAERQRAVAAPVAPVRPPVVPQPPALALDIRIAGDGAVVLDGSASELALVEQRLAALVRGARVEVRLAGDSAQSEKVARTSRQLMAFAREHGLRMEVKLGDARQE